MSGEVLPVNITGYVNITVPQGFSLKANPLDNGTNAISQLFSQRIPDGTAVYTFVGNDPAALPMADDLQSNLVSGFLSQLPPDFAGLVSLSGAGAGLQLRWTGLLQSALEAGGPYTPSLQSTNAISISPLESRRFWRSRVVVDLPPAKFKANVYSDGAWSDPTQTLPPGQGFLIYSPANFLVTFVGQFDNQTPYTNSISAGWSMAGPLVPVAATVTTGLNLKVNLGDRLFRMENGILRAYLFMPSSGWTPSEPSLTVGEGLLLYSGNAFDWVTVPKRQ